MKGVSKYQAATFIAILFHAIGIGGILFFDSEWVIRSTPINLLIMFILLIWTQPGKNKNFWLFFLTCFSIGLGAEITGVNTGFLFGDYKYGNVLGQQIKNVPLIIGLNWFIIIYCCGISIHMLLAKLTNPGSLAAMPGSKILKALSVIIDGAMLAALFDWLMEPVAVKLNYWNWNTAAIPWFNYFCWFIISSLLLTVFQICKFEKKNKFAVNLLLVQLMFFMILRTFLT
ncbi:MAG: carotenoid biosynthesis protein [Ferruginibacter sp.]